MSPQVRVDGQLHDVTGAAVRVDGQLYDVTSGEARVDGVLREVISPTAGVSLSVATLPVSDVETNGAQLNGSVTIFDGGDVASTVDVWFEYRQAGTSGWESTTIRTRSSAGTFAEAVDGLDADTEYEFRAQASAGAGADAVDSTGSVRSFTTGDVPDYTLIDDFESGVDPSWYNADMHATAPDTAREGANSAYRSGLGSIRADPTTFDETISSGSPFMTFGVYSGTGAEHIDISFGRDSFTSLESNSVVVDWSTDTLSIRTLNESNTWTFHEEVDAPVEPDTWYDLTVYWGDNDAIKGWLHTPDGTLIAEVESFGSGQSGEVWAVRLGTTGSSNHRVDYIRSYETHPYTGEHYADLELEPGVTQIDDFEGGDFADVWLSTENYAVTADATANNGQAAGRTSGSNADLLALDPSETVVFEEDGPFAVMRTKTSSQWTYLGFNNGTSSTEGSGDASSFYLIEVNQRTDSLEIWSYDGGWTVEVDVPIDGYTSGQYYTLVAAWVDGQIEGTLYTDDGTEVARALWDAPATTATPGTCWASGDTSNRLDEIELRETHPFTGEDYSTYVPTPTSPSGGETVDIDFDDYYDTGRTRNGLNDVYRVWNIRGNSTVGLTNSRAHTGTASCYHTIADGTQMSGNTTWETNNSNTREVYQEIWIHPNGQYLSENNTMRCFWIGGDFQADQDSGNFDTPPPFTGTNGHSVRAGWTRRLGHDHPNSYTFFVYSYDDRLQSTTTPHILYGNEVQVPMNEWVKFNFYQKMNTYDSGGMNRDGHLKAWVNDQLAIHLSDRAWMGDDGHGIDEFGPLGYDLYQSSTPYTLYFDDHKIWIGDDIPASVRE